MFTWTQSNLPRASSPWSRNHVQAGLPECGSGWSNIGRHDTFPTDCLRSCGSFQWIDGPAAASGSLEAFSSSRLLHAELSQNIANTSLERTIMPRLAGKCLTFSWRRLLPLPRDEDMSTEMQQATASTGGPLHAHWFLRQMSYFGILKKATSRDKKKGKCLQLGFPSKGSKAWYAPQRFSKEIDEEIRAVLSLHECLLSLILLFYTYNLYIHYNICICVHTMIYIYIYIHVFYITTYPALYWMFSNWGSLIVKKSTRIV